MASNHQISDNATISTLIATGTDLIHLERYADALSMFESILILDPNNDTAWWGKGEALRKLNRTSEAIAAFDQSLKIDPNSANVWNSKGVALCEQGLYEEGITAFNRAVQISVKSVYLDNLKMAHQLLAEKEHRDKFGEPIKDTPTLFSWWGIGWTLYEDTHYFTIFFVPIIPLGRYAVEEVDNGFLGFDTKYRFYGKLKLHPWQQTWQALAGGAIGGLVIGLYLLTVI